MSVTFGVSLAMSGSGQTSRHAATMRRVTSGSVAKSTPPETLGHDRFSSSAARPGSSADLRGHLDELVLGLAGDVGDDRGRQRAQVRQVMRDEVIDAVVVEADGVEHAATASRRCAAAGCRRAAAASPSWE